MAHPLASRAKRLLSSAEALSAALILLWAAELFVVQEATLHEHHYYAAYQPFLHRGARAALNLLSCAMLFAVLPRIVLNLLFVGGLGFAGVVLSFENYSGRPLSATMMTSTAGEGVSVANAGFAMLPSWFLLLIITLGIKFLLVHRLRPFPKAPARQRRVRAAKMAIAYLSIIAILNLYKPFTLLLGWESVGGIGSLYGYTPTWVAELVLLDQEEILDRAVERSRVASDRLSEAGEPDFPLGERLVFLQVESLDAAAMTYDIEGQPVTPELRRLSESSMRYTIRSEKKTGSCDADFTALMCALPSVDMPNYKIYGFPYDNSFVHELREWGYLTRAIHNVKGAFFNRREAFAKIAFDQVYFLEELKRDEALPFESWAILDHHMMNWAAKQLSETQGKQFSLIITATSHIPFHYTPPEHRKLFPGNDDLVPSYLDSMHYVDGAIGAFAKALPKGTLLIIYGDHGSFVSSEEYGYSNPEYEGVALVPFLVYQVGSDLSHLQKSRGTGLADSGELTLLDMMSYVRGVTRRHNGSVGPNSADSGPAPTDR